MKTVLKNNFLKIKKNNFLKNISKPVIVFSPHCCHLKPRFFPNRAFFSLPNYP